MWSLTKFVIAFWLQNECVQISYIKRISSNLPKNNLLLNILWNNVIIQSINQFEARNIAIWVWYNIHKTTVFLKLHKSSIINTFLVVWQVLWFCIECNLTWFIKVINPSIAIALPWVEIKGDDHCDALDIYLHSWKINRYDCTFPKN